MRPSYKRSPTGFSQPLVKAEPVPPPQSFPKNPFEILSPRVQRRRVAKREPYSPDAFVESKCIVYSFSLSFDIARSQAMVDSIDDEDGDPYDSDDMSNPFGIMGTPHRRRT